jgi:hypothetical protein
MSHLLPVDIARSLNQQWPCREVQVRQLAGLLSVSFPPDGSLDDWTPCSEPKF